MADSNFRGPINSMGSLETQAGNTATIEVTDGPSLLYQSFGVPDIRSAPFAKDGFRAGQQAGFLGGAFWAIDQIPQARDTSLLATTQVGTVSVAVSLVTTQVNGLASSAFIAQGVPIIPLGTTVATHVIALDFGFATGTTAAGSTTVVVIDNRYFTVGQWIVIGGAGASNQRSHIAQVRTIATANITGITINPAAVAAVSHAPIGQGNLYGDESLPASASLGPTASSASAHSFGGAVRAGLAKVYNPREMLARNITLQAVTAVTYSAIVSGWDLWGNPMTELLSLAAQTSMAGKKAFKYIGSIMSGTSSGTQALSFGIGDTFGLPMRCDEWEQAAFFYNGQQSGTTNGFAAAVTVTATSTTGDVRGTIQLSTAVVTGVLATSINPTSITTNGTSRLAVKQDIGVWNMISGTPINAIPMFGVAQSTATT